MKKPSIVLFVLILSVFMICVLAIPVAAKQSTQKPSRIYDIAVTLINQEPDPAEPGQYVDIRFKFDNNGSGIAENVQVEILPKYPFSLLPGEKAVRNIGTLQSMQRGDAGIIVKYRLKVDKDAIEGENDLSIRYKIEGYDWIEPEEFKVNVRTHDAILSVDSVQVDKEAFEPGSDGTLKIILSNKADSILQDVKASLSLGDVPFVPIGSINEKSVYQISPRESYEIDFELMAEPDAKAGVYKVPLKVSYSDKLGNVYIRNGTIGLIIGAKPDLSITLDTTEIYSARKSGDVVVKVVNKGTTDIKFVNIKLMQGSGYRILSNEEDYLGNIDSDDYETAEFKIYADEKKKKSIMLPINVTFMDANNKKYSYIMDIEMPLYSASEAKKLGLAAGNGKIGFFIVIIVVIAGLFIYRKWGKGRKKQLFR